MESWLVWSQPPSFHPLVVGSTPFKNENTNPHGFELHSSPIKSTAYCDWSVIFSFSILNWWSSSLGLFNHVPLKRDQGDWDWRLRVDDTPNAMGCTKLLFQVIKVIKATKLLFKVTKAIIIIIHIVIDSSVLAESKSLQISLLKQLQISGSIHAQERKLDACTCIPTDT